MFPDKVHMRSECPEVLPPWKYLRLYQHALEFRMVGKIQIDSSAEGR